MGWGIEEAVANSWRRLWKEEVRSGRIKECVRRGGPQERRGRPCSPEAMGEEDSLKLLTVLVEIAITTQANMEVCGGLNSIAIGT